MVAHACNPSCSGGRDQEDQLEASMGKNLESPHLNNNNKKPKNLRVGVHTCNLNYIKSYKEDCCPAGHAKTQDPI
jgi:hypothetical protein